MGYKPNNNEYIIENDVENINKPSYESLMRLKKNFQMVMKLKDHQKKRVFSKN